MASKASTIFPYNNNRALKPNKFKTCHTEQASRRALESSSFFEMHDTYSFSQSSFIGSEEQQECNIVLRREESTSKGLAFVATKPGTADDEDFVTYSGPVIFDSGSSEVQFPISIKDDQQVEAEEFFFVNIVSANTSSQTRLKREYAGLKCEPDDHTQTTVRITEDPKTGEQPLRGHHILNNGILSLSRDIIDGFIRKHYSRTNFLTLIRERYINCDSSLYRSHEPTRERDTHPDGISRDTYNKVQGELSASKPNNAPEYTDQNDQHFGEWKAKFIDTCVQFMCHWVNVKDNAGVNQEKARRGKKQVIEDLFQRDLFHPGKEKNWKNSILLDNQALGWFRSSNKGEPTDGEMARIFGQVFENQK